MTTRTTGEGRGAPLKIDYRRAVALQNALRSKLILSAPPAPIRTVAGADVAFLAGGDFAVAGFLLFSWPSLDPLDVALAVRRVDFPYIPGLLSFREIPVLLDAYRRLSRRPDVLFCDGQGLAHPRRLGLACHLGILLGLSTIGCAKSVLVGSFEEPASARGASSPMLDSGQEIGRALRTRDRVRPMYISPGHMMTIDAAVDLVLAAGRGRRLPEPTRLADKLVARAKTILSK